MIDFIDVLPDPPAPIRSTCTKCAIKLDPKVGKEARDSQERVLVVKKGQPSGILFCWARGPWWLDAAYYWVNWRSLRLLL